MFCHEAAHNIFFQAKQLQEEQLKLLNEILEQIKEEDDPDKLERLVEQQNQLLKSMRTFEAEGYRYEGGIPNVDTEANIEQTPDAAKY